jgi:hypothetical protein
MCSNCNSDISTKQKGEENVKIQITVFVLLVLFLSMCSVNALTTPYSLSGHCYDGATPLVGVSITFTNLNSSEVIVTTSTSGGEYQQDAVNFASGYYDGDTIRYESTYNTLSDNTSANIVVSGGGTSLDLYLSSDSGCNGASALTNTINVHDTEGVGATYSACVVNLRADAIGHTPNSITTTETCTNASFGAVNLTGGSEGQLSGGWDDEGVYTGLDLWVKVAPLLALLISVTLLVLVISALLGMASKDSRFANGLNLYQVISIASVLVAVMAVFSVVPFIGYVIDDIASAGTYAEGTLTFTGDASDGETVSIGLDVYEFNNTGSITPGNIEVDIT